MRCTYTKGGIWKVNIESSNNGETIYTSQLTADGNIDYSPKEDQVKEHDYIGFWLRLVSYIIDLVIVFSIKGFVLSPLKFMNEGYPVEISFWTFDSILSMATFYIYFLLMTKGFNQTIGKMILGIKVVKIDGSKLTWTDLLFREVIGRFLHSAMLILNLLYLAVAFTKEKQGIHDMIGNTIVVQAK